ncbi:MAG: hypothetical protein ACRCTD_10950, partial [Beijerinckiaceae bacterium]
MAKEIKAAAQRPEMRIRMAQMSLFRSRGLRWLCHRHPKCLERRANWPDVFSERSVHTAGAAWRQAGSQQITQDLIN